VTPGIVKSALDSATANANAKVAVSATATATYHHCNYKCHYVGLAFSFGSGLYRCTSVTSCVTQRLFLLFSLFVMRQLT